MAATPTEQLLDHVDTMIRYWASEIGNVPAETSKREALEGLAFSLLVMLDGGAVDGGSWYLAPIGDDGEVGEPIAGYLHETWSDRRRPDQFGSSHVNPTSDGPEQ